MLIHKTDQTVYSVQIEQIRHKMAQWPYHYAQFEQTNSEPVEVFIKTWDTADPNLTEWKRTRTKQIVANETEPITISDFLLLEYWTRRETLMKTELGNWAVSTGHNHFLVFTSLEDALEYFRGNEEQIRFITWIGRETE